MPRGFWRCLLALAALPFVAYSQRLTATPSAVKFFLSGLNNADTPRTCAGEMCIATQTVTTSRTISSFSVNKGNAASVNWLTVTMLSSNSLQVKVDDTNLKDGYYAGRVLIGADGAADSPLALPVQLSVFPADGYSSEETLDTVSGSNTISVANIRIPGFHVNAEVLPISPAADTSWIVVTPANPIPASGT